MSLGQHSGIVGGIFATWRFWTEVLFHVAFSVSRFSLKTTRSGHLKRPFPWLVNTRPRRCHESRHSNPVEQRDAAERLGQKK